MVGSLDEVPTDLALNIDWVKRREDWIQPVALG